MNRFKQGIAEMAHHSINLLKKADFLSNIKCLRNFSTCDIIGVMRFRRITPMMSHDYHI